MVAISEQSAEFLRGIDPPAPPPTDIPARQLYYAESAHYTGREIRSAESQPITIDSATSPHGIGALGNRGAAPPYPGDVASPVAQPGGDNGGDPK